MEGLVVEVEVRWASLLAVLDLTQGSQAAEVVRAAGQTRLAGTLEQILVEAEEEAHTTTRITKEAMEAQE